MEMGIIYFPFRIVGRVPTDYIEENFSEIFWKVFKNPLTKSQKCDIIYM
jgi:hypothetical protein